MFRFALSLILLAAPAVAQDTTQLCAVTSEIAGMAVSERVAGLSKEAASMAITADLVGDRAGYSGAVPPIVDWVWTLPEDQLTDEVAIAYETACLTQ